MRKKGTDRKGQTHRRPPSSSLPLLQQREEHEVAIKALPSEAVFSCPPPHTGMHARTCPSPIRLIRVLRRMGARHLFFLFKLFDRVALCVRVCLLPLQSLNAAPPVDWSNAWDRNMHSVSMGRSTCVFFTKHG